jgi:hypothetical protein
MKLSYNPDTRGPAVQGSAGLKRICEVNIHMPRMELSYKPETRGPAVQGSPGLKKDMGTEHSGCGWSSHTSQIRQCRVKKDTGYIRVYRSQIGLTTC